MGSPILMAFIESIESISGSSKEFALTGGKGIIFTKKIKYNFTNTHF